MGTLLVERQELLDRFAKLVQSRSDTSGGGVVLVAGEAGIGKSTLIMSIAELYKSKFQVVWTGCDPMLNPKPLGPLYDIRGGLGDELQPLLQRSEPFQSVFSATFELLMNSKRPILFIIEDVHWADNATIDLIKYLARRVFLSPCLLIISYRSDEVDSAHPLSATLGLLPPAHTLRLDVPPLSKSGAQELAEEAGQPINNLYEITRGNPFYLTELLASGQLHRTEPPRSIQDAVNARLNRLSPDEKDCLELLSLVPNGVSLQLVIQLFGRIGETLAMACVGRGLLVIDDMNILRFRHELARLSTQANIPKFKQPAMHNKIVVALENFEKLHNLEALVHHSAAARDANRLTHYAQLAAERASKQGAHKEAACYLSTALQMVDSVEAETAANIYERWAYEAGIAQTIDEDVIEARRHAITLWRALGRMDKVGENLRWLSRLHWYRGEAVEAQQIANEAITVLESCEPTKETAMAYSFRSQLYMLHDEMENAISWGEKALALESQHPSSEVRAHALNNIGSAMAMRGVEEGKHKLLESLDIALQNDLHEHAARAFTNISDYCVRFKHFEFADKIINDGITFDTKHDLDSWTYYLLGIQAQLRMEQGRLNDAETISLGVLKLTELTKLMKLPALIVLSRSQSRLNINTWRSHLEEALEFAADIDELQYIIPARLTAVEAAWLGNDEQTAFHHLLALSKLDNSSLDCWRAGETLLWNKRFGFDIQFNFQQELPKVFHYEFSDQTQKAAEKWIEHGLPFNAALAFLHSPESSLVSSLTSVTRIIGSINANGLTEKLNERANKSGIQHKLPKSKRGASRATKLHPLGLTKKEQEVLRQIVEGLNNRQISVRLSRSQRTIENHASSILKKFNVKNRVDAIIRVQNEPWLCPK